MNWEYAIEVLQVPLYESLGPIEVLGLLFAITFLFGYSENDSLGYDDS